MDSHYSTLHIFCKSKLDFLNLCIVEAWSGAIPLCKEPSSWTCRLYGSTPVLSLRDANSILPSRL